MSFSYILINFLTKMAFRLAILIFILTSSHTFAQVSDEDVLQAIRNDELSLLKSYFQKGNDPNRLYGTKNLSLLHYAAMLDKQKPIEVLLEAGANIELVYGGETPLMSACWFGSENALNLLLKKGASVNFQDKTGKTASIVAAQANKHNVLKLLFQQGANFALTDCTKSSPLDYAYKLQHIESYQFIGKVTPNPYQTKKIQDYVDGPYFFPIDKEKVKLIYLFSQSNQDRIFSTDSILFVPKGKLHFSSEKLQFGFNLNISKKIKPQPGIYKGVKKWMAIGDLHGGFDEFSKLLINHKVMDRGYNWIFGDGHLVVAGDIFDRGEKVTECLWLLFKLEQEAEKHSGRVHFLLGNHEIMQLSGDKRYLSDKYLDLFNRNGYDYTGFYGKASIMGQWLRAKNTIVVLDDVLFVHGGISPELANSALSVDAINAKIREIIQRDDIQPIDEAEELLLGLSGPLWYRGYIKLSDNYYKKSGEKFDFDEQKLNKILRKFNIKKIVFANTNVNEISPMYNQKLFGIDIPFTLPGVSLQGLVYDGLLHKALIDGSLVKLN
jgi:ankyrin repeat protein